MKDSYGQYGWREFHRNRQNILDEFDKVTQQTVNRPVKTAHGPAVEAYLRSWLSEFLPKKFAVTSGYIIPNLFMDSPYIYHYDIIIYDNIESPILWTEGNKDTSELGHYRAIPAKHVYAVYEVKSRITKQSASEAISKLEQINAFSVQLNPRFTCGIIFIDLKEQENKFKSILKEFDKGSNIFGFRGGMILRYEGDEYITGLISLHEPNNQNSCMNDKSWPLAKSVNGLGVYLTEEGGLTITEGGVGAILIADPDRNSWYVSKSYGSSWESSERMVLLNWSRSNFATFCMNLLSSLEGTSIDPKRPPMFGMIFDNIQLQKAPLQSEKRQHGLPFISLKIVDSDKNGVAFESNKINLSFTVEIKNECDKEIILSDDRFKTKIDVAADGKVGKFVTLIGECRNVKPFKKKLAMEGFELPYRIVYYETTGEKVLYAVEKLVRFKDSKVEFA